MSGRLTELMTLAAMVATATSCGDSSTGPGNSNLDPANFVTSVTNPLFPLTPGTVFNFEGESGDEAETNPIEVLMETRTILGISATIVHDRVYAEGDLTEETFDWYAQDKDGNVWYLGEDSSRVCLRISTTAQESASPSNWACRGRPIATSW